MMTSIDLGNGQRLELEPARDVLRLVPAVTGAQLELRVRVGVAGGPGTARRLRIAAAVYVSRAAQKPSPSSRYSAAAPGNPLRHTSGRLRGPSRAAASCITPGFSQTNTVVSGGTDHVPRRSFNARGAGASLPPAVDHATAGASPASGSLCMRTDPVARGLVRRPAANLSQSAAVGGTGTPSARHSWMRLRTRDQPSPRSGAQVSAMPRRRWPDERSRIWVAGTSILKPCGVQVAVEERSRTVRRCTSMIVRIRRPGLFGNMNRPVGGSAGLFQTVGAHRLQPGNTAVVCTPRPRERCGLARGVQAKPRGYAQAHRGVGGRHA